MRSYLQKNVAAEQAAAKSVAKPAATKSNPQRLVINKAAKSFGMQLGRMGKMFSGFKDEFTKASK